MAIIGAGTARTITRSHQRALSIVPRQRRTNPERDTRAIRFPRITMLWKERNVGATGGHWSLGNSPSPFTGAWKLPKARRDVKWVTTSSGPRRGPSWVGGKAKRMRGAPGAVE